MTELAEFGKVVLIAISSVFKVCTEDSLFQAVRDIVKEVVDDEVV
jgi:hypothetical protein